MENESTYRKEQCVSGMYPHCSICSHTCEDRYKDFSEKGVKFAFIREMDGTVYDDPNTNEKIDFEDVKKCRADLHVVMTTTGYVEYILTNENQNAYIVGLDMNSDKAKELQYFMNSYDNLEILYPLIEKAFNEGHIYKLA